MLPQPSSYPNLFQLFSVSQNRCSGTPAKTG